MIRSDPALAASKFQLEWTRHMKMSFLIITKKKLLYRNYYLNYLNITLLPYCNNFINKH